MTNDDDDDRGKSEQGGDRSDPSTRDANGRWLKGYCPNPRGRPRKKPKKYLDLSDLRIFGNTMIDVMASGEKQEMDRRAALLHKMYETAMKGRVSMQRFLYKEFQNNAMLLAATRIHHERLVTDWIIENPRLTERGYEIPHEVQTEILALESTLRRYFPTQYPIPRLPKFYDEES